MDTENLHLKKQHFSTRIFKGYFHYLSRTRPDLLPEEICEKAGLPYSYVQNEDNWVSAEFALNLTEICIRETGERNFPFLAGRESVSEKLLGKPIYFLFKYVLPAKSIYSQIVLINPKFSKFTDERVLDSKRGYFKIELSANAEIAKNTDRDTIEKNIRYAVENNVGYLSAIPSAQGFPHANVSFERTSQTDELPCYEIEVRFKHHNPLLGSLLTLLPIPAAMLSTWIASLVSSPGTGTSLGIFFFSLFFFGFVSMAIKFLGQDSKVKQTLQAIDEKDRQYREIFDTKEKYLKLAESYARFVPWDYIRLLKKGSIEDVQIGDRQEADMTVMFSDIRNFTALSESFSPRETFQFLDSFLQRISPVIRKHGGFIDNLIGDAIVALFPNGPNSSVSAASEMLETLKTYNEHREAKNYEPVQMGIGINTGRVVVGTIGHTNEMRATVISDCANTAARLQDLNKRLGSSVVISRETFHLLNSDHKTKHRYLGRFNLRGKKRSVDAFELVAVYPKDMANLMISQSGELEEAIALYETNRLEEAESILKSLIAANPNDPVIKNFLKTLQSRLENTKAA